MEQVRVHFSKFFISTFKFVDVLGRVANCDFISLLNREIQTFNILIWNLVFGRVQFERETEALLAVMIFEKFSCLNLAGGHALLENK